MFLQFNQQQQPEYAFGFHAASRTFTKFYRLQDEPLLATVAPVIQVELPDWNVPGYPIDPKGHNATAPDCLTQPQLAKYANGSVTIAAGCFQGIKRLRLTLPHHYPVRLDRDCFDNDAAVELVLPATMSLKQVFAVLPETNSTCIRHDAWQLVASHDFKLDDLPENYYHDAVDSAKNHQVGTVDYPYDRFDYRDHYCVRDFRPDDAACKITITPLAKLSTRNAQPKLAKFQESIVKAN